MKLPYPEMEEMQKEFHQVWKEYGEPHPNSNKYLALVKSFYYTKGLFHGAEIKEKVEADNESNI